MFGLLLAIHVLVGILLVIIILMQSGRGGGLTETFSGVESIFGTKTNTFLTRGTVVLAVMFLFTSLSLSYLSKKKGESLLQKEVSTKNGAKTIIIPKEQPKTVSEPIKQATEPSKSVETPTAPVSGTTVAENVTVSPTQPTPQDIEKSGQETKQQ